MKKSIFALMILSAMIMTSCSSRLVDFTVISSKNVQLAADLTKGKKVEGKKSYIFGIGWNIKDAMDIALEKAGSEYDLLVDGVVRYGSYPFVAVISVEGTAISSRVMIQQLGEAGYQQWLKGKKLTYNKNTELVSSKK